MRFKLITTCTLMVLSLCLYACNNVVDTKTLEDITWVLESYGEQSNLQVVLEATEITATFNSSEDTVRGSSGCNTYGGVYEVDGSKLSISNIYYTEMACIEPEGVMEQETEYLSLLSNTESYEIIDGKLRITTAIGILTFSTKK